MAADQRRFVGASTYQSLGPLANTKPGQEGGLGQDCCKRARSSRCGHHSRKVSMDGQVRLARAGKGVDLLVPTQGLQGVAKAGLAATIVDQ